VRVVDANVLLYAVNADAPHHVPSRRWLDHALTGGDTVGLSWLPLLAFVRLSTKAEIVRAPLTAAEAMQQVDDWLTAPTAHLLHPGQRHAGIHADLLSEIGTGGNLVSDAHLAALAIEHRARVVSFDNDFAHFPGVRWDRPDALLP